MQIGNDYSDKPKAFRSDDKHKLNRMMHDYGKLVDNKKDKDAARLLTNIKSEINQMRKQ